MKYNPTRYTISFCLILSGFIALPGSDANAQETGFQGYFRAQPNISLSGEEEYPPHDTNSLIEANAELFWEPVEELTTYLDISGFHSTMEDSQKLYFNINEATIDLAIGDSLGFVIGKKRLPWSVSWAFTPTDITNPAGNPLEPSLQREGAYLLSTRYLWETGSVSLIWVPGVEEAVIGYPNAIKFDNQLIGARISQTLFETDLSALAYVYPTDGRLRAGLTASRYFGDIEFHTEFLVYSDHPHPFQKMSPELVQLIKVEDNPTIEFVVGARYQHPDSGLNILVEYFYHGLGFSADNFNSLTELLILAQTSGMETPFSTTELSQVPQLRHHYGVIMIERRKFAEELSFGITTMVSFEDTSFLFYPNLEYRLLEDTVISLGAAIFVGEEDSQFGLSPYDALVLARLSAHF